MSIHALVPDATGVSIVDVQQLAARLDVGEEPQEAIDNSGIDYLGRLDADGLATQLERVRQLNLTGDSNAFWGRT